jgi:hypothetical protein
MKVLILKSAEGHEGIDCDWAAEPVTDVFLVPDDFTNDTLESLRKEWFETWETYQFYNFNQWRKRPTILFHDWLRQRFDEKIEFVDCQTDGYSMDSWVYAK